MGIERSTVLLRMKSAIREGLSASRFIREMRSEGLGYRRQTMLADWRSATGVTKKEGSARYVRRDYRPTAAVVADVSWDLSREYMNKVNVQYRTRPGEPIVSRFVNVMSDRPLTPRELEQSVLDNLVEWQDSIPGVVERVIPWTILHRVPEWPA